MNDENQPTPPINPTPASPTPSAESRGVQQEEKTELLGDEALGAHKAGSDQTQIARQPRSLSEAHEWACERGALSILCEHAEERHDHEVIDALMAAWRILNDRIDGEASSVGRASTQGAALITPNSSAPSVQQEDTVRLEGKDLDLPGGT